MSAKLTLEDWDEYSEELETKSIGDNINCLFGMEFYTLTEQQLNELRNGKVLYGTINGEYAFAIKMGESKNGT